MVSSKKTKRPFTQRMSSRTGFLRIRMIFRNSPDHRTRQSLILLKLCGLYWRLNCVVSINRYHRHLNLPPHCRKNGKCSLRKPTETVSILRSCFESVSLFHTRWGNMFSGVSVFVQLLYIYVHVMPWRDERWGQFWHKHTDSVTSLIHFYRSHRQANIIHKLHSRDGKCCQMVLSENQ